MLDPENPLMLALLWVTLLGVLAALALRTLRWDKREYRRFKRFRTTRRRQLMLRRWLLISFFLFGGLALASLLASGQFATPLLAEVRAWPWVTSLLGVLSARPGVTAGVIAGLAVGVIAVTVVAIISVRKEGDEVLLFRLALPALLFATTGNAIVAITVSLLLFGLMHSYQGLAGIIITTVLGAAFMALYVLTGSILITIIAHALLDLRSLVLIPMAIGRVHRIDGRRTPFTHSPKPRPTSVEPTADTADAAEVDAVAPAAGSPDVA